MAHVFLLLWIVLFGIVLIVRTIPRQLRRVRTAVRRAEKISWILNVTGCMIAAYGAIVTGLMMLDDFRGGPWQLSAWWPSPSRFLWGVGDRMTIALLDLLLALTASLIAIGAARYFGYLNEQDVWSKADLLAGGRTDTA